MFVYAGGYTTPDRDGRGDGIHVFRAEEAWVPVQHVAAFDNPSMLKIGPGGQALYVAHGGREVVSAYAIDRATGRLALLGEERCGGVNPVDLGFDPAGRFVVVANYSSGTVALLPIGAGGALLPAVQVIALGTPGGPAALPHGVTFDPAGRFVLVPDKGLDRVFVFALDVAAGRLVAGGSGVAASGAGPRHAAFHPRLPMLYVVNELSPTVDVFRWREGRLEAVQSITRLPEGEVGESLGAEIAATEGCVYASNRGHDSITTYRVDPAQGTLRFAGCTATGGREPRLFALDPRGGRLHVANQGSDTVMSFALDAETGAIGAGRLAARLGSPSALCFLAESGAD